VHGFLSKAKISREIQLPPTTKSVLKITPSESRRKQVSTPLHLSVSPALWHPAVTQDWDCRTRLGATATQQRRWTTAFDRRSSPTSPSPRPKTETRRLGLLPPLVYIWDLDIISKNHLCPVAHKDRGFSKKADTPQKLVVG
jgi:hypothetical protein